MNANDKSEDDDDGDSDAIDCDSRLFLDHVYRTWLYCIESNVGTAATQTLFQQYKCDNKEDYKMQALGAAMRKLIQICFGVIKNQTKYQSEITLN